MAACQPFSGTCPEEQGRLIRLNCCGGGNAQCPPRFVCLACFSYDTICKMRELKQGALCNGRNAGSNCQLYNRMVKLHGKHNMLNRKLYPCATCDAPSIPIDPPKFSDLAPRKLVMRKPTAPIGIRLESSTSQMAPEQKQRSARALREKEAEEARGRAVLAREAEEKARVAAEEAKERARYATEREAQLRAHNEERRARKEGKDGSKDGPKKDKIETPPNSPTYTSAFPHLPVDDDYYTRREEQMAGKIRLIVAERTKLVAAQDSFAMQIRAHEEARKEFAREQAKVATQTAAIEQERVGLKQERATLKQNRKTNKREERRLALRENAVAAAEVNAQKRAAELCVHEQELCSREQDIARREQDVDKRRRAQEEQSDALRVKTAMIGSGWAGAGSPAHLREQVNTLCMRAQMMGASAAWDMNYKLPDKVVAHLRAAMAAFE